MRSRLGAPAYSDSIVSYAERKAAKEVVHDLGEAEREVERLNRLNESKVCRYFWPRHSVVCGWWLVLGPAAHIGSRWRLC